MISDLDRTLEQLLRREFGAVLPFDLSFAIPDRNFTPVTNARSTLNCYLYDIREDRELRRVEPYYRSIPGGGVEREVPPARVKLTYCITAWSPLLATPGTPPALDEHSLLSDVLRLLLRYPTLPPDVLVGTLAGQEPPLPTEVARPEIMEQVSDFWNAIGGQLRPSLDYSVTLSLEYEPPTIRDRVTTVRPRFGGSEGASWIGGTVYDNSAPPNGVPGAWVRVNETDQTFVADAAGQFRIGPIAGGNYTLTVRAVGFQEGNRAVQVPEPNGVYDVTLVPL